jgi:UDP-glucose 4-epimerase
MGTTHVLEAARTNGVQRVHLASTVWVYNGSPNGSPADESVPFYPDGAGHIYTSSKIASEMICHNYQQLYKVPVTVLRYGIPYGPRMREELLIPVFLKKALTGQPLTVAGEGKQFRKFLYVTDLARAHVMVMDGKAASQTYNLEGDRQVTVLEVAEAIRENVGAHVRIEFVPQRSGDFGGKEVSAEKARREIGWEPTIEFREGMRDTVAWFRKTWGL